MDAAKLLSQDPAVAAYARMIAAGEHDDDGYAAAMNDLEVAEPATLAGVSAKLHALKIWFNIISCGDELTEHAWDMIREMFASADRTLERLQAQ